MKATARKLFIIGICSVLFNQTFLVNASINDPEGHYHALPTRAPRCSYNEKVTILTISTVCCLFWGLFIPLSGCLIDNSSVGNDLTPIPAKESLDQRTFQVNLISCGTCLNAPYLFLPYKTILTANHANLGVFDAYKAIDHVCVIEGSTSDTPQGCFRKGYEYAVAIGQAPAGSKGIDYDTWLVQLAKKCGDPKKNNTAHSLPLLKEMGKRAIAGKKNQTRSLKSRLTVGNVRSGKR